MNTLYDYYNSKGQSLPSISQRQQQASQAGIKNYTGTASQNAQLLQYLNNAQPTQPTQPVQPTQPTTPTQSGQTQQNVDINATLKQAGLDDNIISQLSNEAKTSLGVFYDYSNNQLLNGKFAETDIRDFNKYLEKASTDPEIQQKYGDMLKMDMSDVNYNINLLNSNYNRDAALQQTQFQNQQKDLGEQYANAGTAYSGFRNKAAQDLKNEQSGIIESKRAQLQSQLRNIGTGLEKVYGTKGLNQFGNISAGGQTYNPVGGIIGTYDQAKAADTRNLAGQFYNETRLPFSPK